MDQPAPGSGVVGNVVTADTINADAINARAIDAAHLDVVTANATTFNATAVNAGVVAASSVYAATVTASATVDANAISATASLTGASLALRGAASGTVSLTAAPAGNYTLVLPCEQAATGQVLANDGSGWLYWVSAITQQTYVAGTVWVPVCISFGVDSGKVPYTGDFNGANKRTLSSTACRVTAFWTARGGDPKAYSVNLNRQGTGDNDTAPVAMTEMYDGSVTFQLEKIGGGTVRDVGLSIVVFY